MTNVLKKQFHLLIVVLVLSSVLLLMTGCPCGLNANLTVSPSQVEMLVGKQMKLGIKSKCLIHREFEWSSENPNVVSVSPEGVITAEGVGETTITVHGCTGLAKATVDVLVVEEPPLTVSQGQVDKPFVDMDLGHGMDITKGVMLNNTAFSEHPIKAKFSGASSYLKFEVHENLHKLRTSMNLSYKSSMNLGFESQSAEYKATADFSRDTHTIYGVVKWSMVGPRLGIADNYSIKRSAKNLYTSDYGYFHELYGDYYLDSIKLEASFYGIVKVHVTNQTEAATACDTFQSKVGPAETKAKMQAKLDELQQDYRMSFTIFTKGGPPIVSDTNNPSLGDLFQLASDYEHQVAKDFDTSNKTLEKLAETYSSTAIFKTYSEERFGTAGLQFDESNEDMTKIAKRYYLFEELKGRLQFIYDNWDYLKFAYPAYDSKALTALLYTDVPQYMRNLEDLADTYSPNPDGTEVWTADLSNTKNYPDPQDYLDNLSVELYCRDCEEYATLLSTKYADGPCLLYVSGNPSKPYRAYCSKDNISTNTYLVLKNTDSQASTNPHYNYASKMCVGTVSPQVCSGNNIYTVYQKIRIVRNESDVIHVDLYNDDFALTSPHGSTPVHYAMPSSCGEGSQQAGSPYKGKANIDLRGTGFASSDENQWYWGGWEDASERGFDVEKTDNNQVVDLTVSGYCGHLGVSGGLELVWVGESE